MSDRLEPGATLGPYRVVRVLGSGGMGVVLEAYDAALRRRVALKVIAPHLAEDTAFRSRFIREARALAALDSPHVVQVYAHGEQDGRLYLATQLVPDGDLGALLHEAGPLPVAQAVELAGQVAAGLAAAHAVGLVHRDIKPANVLLRRGEPLTAYLSDFGVVRHLSPDHTRGPATGAVGTPSYMAPELHTGGEAGVASDVYSLGCLLWAALTGRAPYAGASDFEVVTAHREAPVPQLAGREPMVIEVNRVLRRALAKDPAARHGSAAELRDDLARAARLPAPAGSVAVAEVPGRSGRRPVVLLVAGLVALVLVAALATAYVLTRGEGESPAAPPSPVPTDPGPSPPRPEALATATASLADALEAQGVLTREQAECAAKRWIEGAGLEEMAAAGFFDTDWTYVDQDRSAMTPEMERAASEAVFACAST